MSDKPKRRRRGRGRHAIGAQPPELPEVEDPFEDADEPDEDAPDDDQEEDFYSAYGQRRTALRRKRRKRAASRVGAGVLAGALVAAALIAAPNLFTRDPDGTPDGSDDGGRVARRDPITTLVFGTRERSRGAEPLAVWLTLLFFDPANQEGAVVQIPSHTAAEVPGRGLISLGDSYASGGIPLLLVSLENMLGVPIDRYLELSDRDARVFFSSTGPLNVDVPEDVRVSAGRRKTRTLFPAGVQQIKPRFLVRLLYTRGLDTDDLDLGARHLAFWDAIFDSFENDPDALAQAVIETEGALSESDADIEQLANFFGSLAELPRVSLRLTNLPIRPAAAGDDELYATDADEIRGFAASTFGRIARAREEDVRVQVLNGNGVPGIGQVVAEKLVGRGFRVILSGNARRLDYKRTLIVSYDDSEHGLGLAERAKELLGVGQVQVAGQQQGIVDLTIVVGKDFVDTL